MLQLKIVHAFGALAGEGPVPGSELDLTDTWAGL
jgi:hypothetical protein